jgi:hypothetical protein
MPILTTRPSAYFRRIGVRSLRVTTILALPDVTLEASLECEVLVRPNAGGAIGLITVSRDPL